MGKTINEKCHYYVENIGVNMPLCVVIDNFFERVTLKLSFL